MADNMNTLKIA